MYRNKLRRASISICLCLLFLLQPSWMGLLIHADQIDDLQRQIDYLAHLKQLSEAATTPLEQQVSDLTMRIQNAQNGINAAKKQAQQVAVSIQQREATLGVTYELFAHRVLDQYKHDSSNWFLLTLLSHTSAQSLTLNIEYRLQARQRDQQQLEQLSRDILSFEQDKKNLENTESRLASLQASLDQTATFFKGEITKAKAYQQQLAGQIAQLSAQQQQLLAAKLASLNIPLTAYTTQGGCSSDLTNGKNPGFSPRFGLFTYGVPHRVGMSQYGAKGRAEAGQNAQQILQAYYNNIQITNVGTGVSIHVVGTNEYGQSFNVSWNIEEYLKHIYEMPANWPSEALKAQAIAARSIALSTTNNGASAICPSQSCQVVKQELNSQAWIDAVNSTSGQVASFNGQPIKAWFSSTAGGYFHSSASIGWSSTSYTKNGIDTNGSIGNFGDLQSKAYDKSSPWFYCDWGGRSQYQGTAWLKSNELADIVNVILLANADHSTVAHLSQLDKSNPDGTDTWDPGRVQQELRNRNITPFSNISNGNVDWDMTNGATNTIHFSGDGGSVSFSGDNFKNFFNLRAPSNINIVGPLYNIEQQ